MLADDQEPARTLEPLRDRVVRRRGLAVSILNALQEGVDSWRVAEELTSTMAETGMAHDDPCMELTLFRRWCVRGLRGGAGIGGAALCGVCIYVLSSLVDNLAAGGPGRLTAVLAGAALTSGMLAFGMLRFALTGRGEGMEEVLSRWAVEKSRVSAGAEPAARVDASARERSSGTLSNPAGQGDMTPD
jgi:hypothetical protein